MRIVIDLQGAQSSNSRNRGIGRYTWSLVSKMIELAPNHEIVLVLNGSFTQSVEAIVDSAVACAPNVSVEVWYPPVDVAYQSLDRSEVRKAVEFIRENFIIALKPDVILVTSLFEGCDDSAVTSVNKIAKIPTAVILYDLIPLVNREIYLAGGGTFTEWYYEKIRHLKKSDKLLAISESSRQEAIAYLDYNSEDVVSISTAADEHFEIVDLTQAQEISIRAKYNLAKRFVMYTGGIERRKNIERLIVAFSRLPTYIKRERQLAVVCSISPYDHERLTKLAIECGLEASDFVFTGYVPEQDLVALYNLCELFVFPSWHEGFGLPALEAMQCGAPVITANTSSLPEVVGRAEAMFDPKNEDAIAAKMAEVLGNTSLLRQLKADGLNRAKLFSWEITAAKAIEMLIGMALAVEPPKMVMKPRLAYVSPLPPERSGISDYSAELIPYLAKFYDIDVIVSQAEIELATVSESCSVRSTEWLINKRDSYDRVLYHFGNSHYHEHMFDLIKKVPGVVVLHDFYLSNFIHYFHCSYPGRNIIETAMYKSHGFAALKTCEQYHWSQAKVVTYPCNFGPLASAVGVIVHSRNSVTLAKTWYNLQGREWDVIPLLRVPSALVVNSKSVARKKLGLRDSDFVVASFGFLAPTKLSLELYEAWMASNLAKDSSAVLVFVGQSPKNDYGIKLDSLVTATDCESSIKITGWAEEELFRDYLAAADVGVQLRTSSRGETSAAVLDCMNYGLATIINANGSMAEIPDDLVYKMQDEFAPDELVTALEALSADRSLRASLGQRAKAFVADQHDPLKCADQYFRSIEAYYSNVGALPFKLAQTIGENTELSKLQCKEIAKSIDLASRPAYWQKQWLVDVSHIVGSGTELSSVADLSSVKNWLIDPPVGYRVEPIVFSEDLGIYTYARNFALKLLGLQITMADDEEVAPWGGDVVVFPKFLRIAESQARTNKLKWAGVEIRYYND